MFGKRLFPLSTGLILMSLVPNVTFLSMPCHFEWFPRHLEGNSMVRNGSEVFAVFAIEYCYFDALRAKWGPNGLILMILATNITFLNKLR